MTYAKKKLALDVKHLEDKVRDLQRNLDTMYKYHDSLVNRVTLLTKATGHSMHYVEHRGPGHWELGDGSD